MEKKKTKAKKGLTPLMKQYGEVKTKYPNAILLFRVGDFYETFGEDAVKASAVLGIVLTARNNGGDQTELAGFPYHSLDVYLPKLVKAGFRVAICEQLEKPSKEKKIVKRGVTELVTPGVAVNDKILDHKTNNYLASVHFAKKDQLGIAFLDISTGEFLVSEGSAAHASKLVQSFSPSEILFSKGQGKDFHRLFGDKHYTFPLDEWIFTLDYGREKVLERFQVNSLKGFGVEDLDAAQIAAGSILHYLATTENTNLQHINRLSRIQADHYVWLDRFSIRNLELVYSQNETGIPLLEILDKTVSPMGARMMKRWTVLPLKDLNGIQARHDMVEFFILELDQAKQIEQQIHLIGDIERLISKVPLGKINPREVAQLKKALFAIEPIKEQLAQCSNKGLQQLADQINPCIVMREQIDAELVEDPPVNLNKGGAIADGVSKDLDEYRGLVNNSKEILLEIQKTEAEKTGITTLKIGFNNVFGYYLEVTNKYKGQNLIPDHWVRKQTLTGSERYITDELKKLEGKILGAEEKILDLEQKLFAKLVFSLHEYIEAIQLNAQLIAKLDCLLSFSKIAVKNNYSRPEMNNTLQLDIKEGRHPVIEQHLDLGEDYVPNDTYLDSDEQQLLIITGPNMSGKSAILRQTALIVLMAQMGSFVPARKAKIGVVDKIFTRVGASDNISSGESTFMVEMNETASIMNNISERSLILLDEIGRGTSTYDGISIAWSIAEFLHNNEKAKPKTLFATHYHELNELANKFSRIKNFHVSTKEVGNKVIFLRKLVSGGSHHSFGIHVAKMAGMPDSIVARAAAILIQLEKKSIEQGSNNPMKDLKQPMQLSIFDSQDPKLGELKDLVEGIDVNSMTPIDCMLKINELKKFLEED